MSGQGSTQQAARGSLGDERVVVALPVLPLVGLTLLLLRPAGCGALVGMEAAKAVGKDVYTYSTYWRNT